MKNSQNFPKVMVTGHRRQGLSSAQVDFAQKGLAKTAERLSEAFGMEEAISGLALGADTWWAQIAVSKGIPLAAYIPYPQQADRWSAENRAEWQKFRSAAHREVLLGDAYAIHLLFSRNDAMIRDCDLAVAVWQPSRKSGGTTDAVKKIRKIGKPLVIIDLDDLVVRRENF